MKNEIIIDRRDVIVVEEYPYTLSIELATVVAGTGLILTSPDGSRWQQVIDNDGNSGWTKLT